MSPNEKHLEFIQGAITRMNQNSFQMKGWAITVFAALLALFASTQAQNSVYLFVSIAPTILFWLLDSYYLQQERKFRGIYNDVAGLIDESQRIDVRPFEMPIHKYEGGKYSFWGVVFSQTMWPIYTLMILGAFVIGTCIK
jgi:hypothetical protein